MLGFFRLSLKPSEFINKNHTQMTYAENTIWMFLEIQQ